MLDHICFGTSLKQILYCAIPPTFGVGSFRIVVNRDHDDDTVLSGIKDDQ